MTTGTNMREWEIVLGDRATSLTVSATSKADARMQAQALLPRYYFGNVWVRDLSEPSSPELSPKPLSAADLEQYSGSLGDPKTFVEWDVLVEDCESPGMPPRPTGLQVMSNRLDDAFVKANMLLPRMHPEMLSVRLSRNALGPHLETPWSPEQAARIVEIFGANSSAKQVIPILEENESTSWPLQTFEEEFDRLIVVQDVNGQGITFMRGTGIMVSGTHEQALEKARALLPGLRPDMLDVRDPASLKGAQPAPWSPKQVEQLIKEYGPDKPKDVVMFTWEVSVVEINRQAFHTLKSTGLTVTAHAREDAVANALLLLPHLRPEIIDVRCLAWAPADESRPYWSSEQVKRMLEGLNPTLPTSSNRQCERFGCSTILCDRLILEGSCYLCDDCYQQLLEAKKSWPKDIRAWRVRILIEDFLRRYPPETLVYPPSYQPPSTTVDEEFERLTSKKGVSDGQGA